MPRQQKDTRRFTGQPRKQCAFAVFSSARVQRGAPPHCWKTVMPRRRKPLEIDQHTALLIVDMINDFDFEGGADLLRNTQRIVAPLKALRARMTAMGCPVVFCNDNFGQWRSDFRQVVKHCCAGDARGHAICRAMRPAKDDYFVLKPRHSAFYGTPLEALLDDVKAIKLVVAGIAGDGCVLSTASDAHIRQRKVMVPRDCMASITDERNDNAASYLYESLRLDARPSTEILAA
jgi:nicotinamidase-related amidase